MFDEPQCSINVVDIPAEMVFLPINVEIIKFFKRSGREQYENWKSNCNHEFTSAPEGQTKNDYTVQYSTV